MDKANETRTCPVCGKVYGRKRYYDKEGRFKTWGPLSATCSRTCRGIVERSQWTERFWKKVDKTGGPDACWPFMGSRNQQGYGQYGIEGKGKKAHRVAWTIANGREPSGDVRHDCDNPPCCNPAHLIDGTTQDNILDMEIKGRARHGFQNGRTILSDDDVRAIRVDPRTQYAIAQDYHISPVQVGQIKRRLRRAYVPD